MGINIAGGAQKVNQAAADLNISAEEFVEAERGTASSLGERASAAASGAPARLAAATTAAALAGRGVPNSSKSTPSCNTDTFRLGEEIGSTVMGPVQWPRYVTTSAKEMPQGDKPFTANKTQALAAG